MRIEGSTQNAYAGAAGQGSAQNGARTKDIAAEASKASATVKAEKPNIIMVENYSELAHKPEAELSLDEKSWIEVIEKANKAIIGANKSFEYSIHEKTKQIMVKVINSETKEVIREIPPEKILDLVAKMWEVAGLLIDERR